MIFVDTGVWFAAVADGRQADWARQALQRHVASIATSSTVLTELWNLLARSGYRHAATPACRHAAEQSRMLHPSPEDHEHALRILGDWTDQAFSYGDAVSFALMERHGITDALTFDARFSVYRYGAEQARAFRVLPE